MTGSGCHASRSLTLLRHTPDISKLAHCVYRLVAPRRLRNGVRNSWLAHSLGSYSKRSLEVAEPSSLLPDSENVAAHLQQIVVFINDQGFVALFKNMPRATMPLVEIDRVAGLKRLHQPGKIPFGGLQ